MTMQQAIGVKLINFKPMTRQEYNDFRGWILPEDEDGTDDGYLVEYIDGGKANTSDYAGYVSWSPKDVFDRAYRPTNAMTFGLAIEAMKMGKRVARVGWNGKGMWVAYTPGSSVAREHIKSGHALSQIAAEFPNANSFAIGGHIDMRAADGSLVVGWLASQTDMLAEDWMLVE